jgi:olefin beta-lactone synthetase
MEMVNTVEIIGRLQIHASSQPDRLAIIDSRRQRSISFAQLNNAVRMAARQFQEAGIHSTATVFLLLPTAVNPSIEQWIGFISLLHVGATPCFIDPTTELSDLEQSCIPCSPDALIATWKTHVLKFRSPVLRQISMQFTIGFPVPGTRLLSVLPDSSLKFRPDSSIPAKEIDLVTQPTLILANLISGTTSLMTDPDRLSRHLLLKSADDAEPVLGLSPSTLSTLTAKLDPGSTARPSNAVRPAKVIRLIQQYQPQTITTSPHFLEQLTIYSEQHSLKLSSFHRISSDGTPMMPRLLDRLQTIAPQAEVISVYGVPATNPIAQVAYRQIQMTEIAAMSAGKGLLVGYPEPGISLKIIRHQSEQSVSSLNQDFADRGLPSCSIGEIVVQGKVRSEPKIMRSSALQVNGVSWYGTGDAGYLDEQGRLWLMGQCDTRIVDEQGVLYPFAVEVAASFHDGVQRTAIDHQQGRRVLRVELKRSVARDAKAQEACLNTLKLVLGWANLQDYQVVDRIPG